MVVETSVFAASAATPATFSDFRHTAQGYSDDTMAFEYPEQLLTPENSRSETSSNNEHAFSDEKLTLRRSTRAKRGSLRTAKLLNDSTTATAVQQTASGKEWDKNDAPEREDLQMFLAPVDNGLAAVELYRENETRRAPRDGNTAHYEPPMTPHTPVSNYFQELKPGSTSASLQPQVLRDFMEKVLAGNEDNGSEQEETPNTDSRKPLRRSTRLSSVHKISDFENRASGILGKRSRSTLEKGNGKVTVNERRVSLRPRKSVAASKEKPAAAATTPSRLPTAKRQRVSESDSPFKPADEEEEEATTEKRSPTPSAVLTQNRRKIWLSSGLYAGQEHTKDPRPVRNRRMNSKKIHSNFGQSRLLPMPMFAGDQLLMHGRDFKLPFDVFSPLPHGQPKPNEWRKINKNVFVGDAGNIWKANKNIELSSCTCTEDTGCDENCQNRFMFYECDDSNCRLGPECGNRSFEELRQRTKAGGKYNIGVEVIKTLDRGYGVRSNRTFDPNQIIVEYTGEIITQDECERRMRNNYKNNDCYYLMYFDQNMIIDATRGSIARFVNHSCEPNCRMEKWTVAGKPRMALFAGSRGIMTGEELSYDYNFDPYSQKNVQECRCRSSKCRGVLGPRPKDKESRLSKRLEAEEKKASRSKAKKSATSTEIAGTKRKNGTALDESTSRLNKKRKLPTSQLGRTTSQKAVAKTKKGSSTSKTSVSQHKKASPRKRGRPTKAEKAKSEAEKAKSEKAKSEKAIKTAKKSTKKSTKTDNVAKRTTKKVETVAKATSSPESTASTTKPTASKGGQVKEAKPKKTNIKLPTLKTKTKIKTSTTVHAKKSSTESTVKKDSEPSPTEKSASKLQRPSAKTKAKILATAKLATPKRRTTNGENGKQTETKKVTRKPAGSGKATKETAVKDNNPKAPKRKYRKNPAKAQKIPMKRGRKKKNEQA